MAWPRALSAAGGVHPGHLGYQCGAIVDLLYVIVQHKRIYGYFG